MARWVLDRDPSEQFLSWHGLLGSDGDRSGSILVTRAKLIRNSGTLHPQSDKLRDILVSFLFECGDKVVQIEAASLASQEHVVDRMAESIPAVALLKSVKEKETLCAQNSCILLFSHGRAPGNHTQGAADCLGARRGPVDSFLS